MSAQEHLSTHQFPVYEKHGYTERDEVSPTHFGITYDEDPVYGNISGEPETKRVPLHQVRTDQDYVYRPHVENLARVPAEHLEKHAREPLPEAYHVGADQYMLTHGNHRVAAASLRGDHDVLLRVWGQA